VTKVCTSIRDGVPFRPGVPLSRPQQPAPPAASQEAGLVPWPYRVCAGAQRARCRLITLIEDRIALHRPAGHADPPDPVRSRVNSLARRGILTP